MVLGSWVGQRRGRSRGRMHAATDVSLNTGFGSVYQHAESHVTGAACARSGPDGSCAHRVQGERRAERRAGHSRPNPSPKKRDTTVTSSRKSPASVCKVARVQIRTAPLTEPKQRPQACETPAAAVCSSL